MPGYAAEKGNEKLLPDDYVFSGIDGRIVPMANDKWAFEFDSAANIGGVEIKQGHKIEMLGSATLEKMEIDAKDRKEAAFRIWAKTTKFEGKNYLFAVYYLSLRKIDAAKEQDVNAIVKSPAQNINSPDDVVNIPADIVALLKKTEVIPSSQAQEIRQQELKLKQDTIFTSMTGIVEEINGNYVFKADALGLGVNKFNIKLLPCQKLEEAISQVRGESNRVRFNATGILTRFKGEQYLLLQKATRVYSYGNFGQ